MATRLDTAADAVAPLLRSMLGDELPITVRFWDGSQLGPPSETAIVLRSPLALRRLLWAPDELGLGRAHVAGELDIDGDVFDVLALRERLADADLHLGGRAWARAARAAARLGVVGPPLPPPPEEARLRGRRHSPARDAAAIAHHYDVSDEFYRLVLGETMTYSCAYFARPGIGLDDAQRAKYELVCRKLGLRPGMRLLDVGCGWGGMVMHAAEHHGVTAVGVTISANQADAAAKRVADAGLAERVTIRRCDYRDIDDGPYDAVSSIGMFEHVGVAQLGRYFAHLHSLLRPGGRLLNHGIARPGGRARFDRRSFIERFVFPDGELLEVGTVVSAMQANGFEVRDLENLREHYARTLRAWVANLESGWEEAEALVGPGRARVWRLYMAGSAVNFDVGRNSIHQVLAVRPEPDGSSRMPPTRHDWLAPDL